MDSSKDPGTWPVADACGSPIERKFFGAWMKLLIDMACRWRVLDDVDEFNAIPERSPVTLLSVQQFDAVMLQQHIGKYRADFVLGRVAYDVEWPLLEDGTPNTEERGTEILRRLPLVVVECDGHDFHERTKEQAQRDKSRDREMLAMGYRVVRFTGSELHRDAGKCAKEVDFLFDCMLRPNIARLATGLPE